MSRLYNKRSAEENKVLLMQETFLRKTISFYNYFPIADTAAYRDMLYRKFAALDIFGRVYIAAEGINAQISVPEVNMDAFVDVMETTEGLQGLRQNIAVDDDGKSFWVLKIKVRDKVVADGIEDPAFSMENRGDYVDAAAFNKLTEEEGTVVIDMRNHYEYEVGHFKKAIEIPSDTFRAQLPMAAEMMAADKEKNIIMYCTGGIRCEKASAYMKHHGFKNVFHLEGGIINYTNEVKKQELPNKFIGKNFVFDNRLGERVTDDVIAQCHQCGEPADDHTNCANEACHLLFIQCKACKEKFHGCCSEDCNRVFRLPEEEQKELRKGIDKGNMIFNKSKQRMQGLNQNKLGD